MMKRMVFCLVTAGVALLGLSGCPDSPTANTPARKDDKPQTDAKPPERRYLVRTAPVRVQPVQYSFDATGSLQADNIYRIDAQVGGVVEGVNFKEGDRVTPQTVLCRISPRTYELAAQRAKVAWQTAKDAWQKALADLADTERKSRNDVLRAKLIMAQAQRDVERLKPAFASGALSQDGFLQVQDKNDVAAIDLKDLEEASTTLVQVMRTAAQQKETEAKQAEVEAQQADEDLRKSAVVSPVAGIIDQRFISDGTLAAPGTPVPIAQVAGLGLKLSFTLPEKESAHLREKTRVMFQTMAYPQRDFGATVYYVSSLADPKTRAVTCWADVDKTDAVLKSGFFATVKIVTEAHDNAVVVPLTAVLPTEQGFVAYVVREGKAFRRPVVLGLQAADQAVEVQKGLTLGEIIVVEGGNALQDGVLVREQEIKN